MFDTALIIRINIVEKMNNEAVKQRKDRQSKEPNSNVARYSLPRVYKKLV